MKSFFKENFFTVSLVVVFIAMGIHTCISDKKCIEAGGEYAHSKCMKKDLFVEVSDD